MGAAMGSLIALMTSISCTWAIGHIWVALLQMSGIAVPPPAPLQFIPRVRQRAHSVFIAAWVAPRSLCRPFDSAAPYEPSMIWLRCQAG